MKDARQKGPIITLDGPAGSGKSSTARALAKRLGFLHIDSGALYRALTLGLLRSKFPEEDWGNLETGAFENLNVDLEIAQHGFTVLINGQEVSSELRSTSVTDRVSFVSSLPACRESILELQRKAGDDGGLVADGRDMGTVVFPHAELKVYLIADLAERAKRRLIEVGKDYRQKYEITDQAKALDARDRSDTERLFSPLKKPEDAIELDTTNLAIEEQVQTLVELVYQLTL